MFNSISCHFIVSPPPKGGGWAEPKMAKPILGRGVGDAV